MRQYVRNILIYLVALFCIICFIGLFASLLESFDEINNTWTPYKVNAFLGEKDITGQVSYKGSIIPIFGFIIPLAIAIVLIIESFKKAWSGYLKVINTCLSVLLFLCAIDVLLTKELFLYVNEFGLATNLRNGVGPRMCAVSAFIGGFLLLVTSWIPFKNDIKFIDRD